MASVHTTNWKAEVTNPAQDQKLGKITPLSVKSTNDDNSLRLIWRETDDVFILQDAREIILIANNDDFICQLLI